MLFEVRITWAYCQSVQIERAFTGEELVRRMKGWVTVDPSQVIEIVNRFGRLKVLDDTELFIEAEKVEDFQNLQKAIVRL